MCEWHHGSLQKPALKRQVIAQGMGEVQAVRMVCPGHTIELLCSLALRHPAQHVLLYQTVNLIRSYSEFSVTSNWYHLDALIRIMEAFKAVESSKHFFSLRLRLL